jgi:DNA primase
MREKIVDFLDEQGIAFKEKNRTIHVNCPICDRGDKFSILKENGAAICYRGSCEFGRRWFADFVALTLGVEVKEAKKILNQVDYYKEHDFLKPKDEWNPLEVKITEVSMPEKSFSMACDSEGSAYLQKRGISPAVAQKYGIMYSGKLRRVIFPVYQEGKLVGYQGRAIDKVDERFKAINSEGFRRDSMVMFLDQVSPRSHIIIAEGPVDALKFDSVGNSIATMGKLVTDKQVDLIKSKQPSSVYLALDDDAYEEMTELSRKFDVPIFKVDVPKECIERCKQAGKKADFGECTPEEASQAFRSAQQISQYSVILPWGRK